MRRAKNAASMRSPSSKLHARRRIDESALYAAQARKRPALSSTRTVSPESALPPATLPSKIQGWRRSSERSLPGRMRTVFIGAILDCTRAPATHARAERALEPAPGARALGRRSARQARARIAPPRAHAGAHLRASRPLSRRGARQRGGDRGAGAPGREDRRAGLHREQQLELPQPALPLVRRADRRTRRARARAGARARRLRRQGQERERRVHSQPSAADAGSPRALGRRSRRRGACGRQRYRCTDRRTTQPVSPLPASAASMQRASVRLASTRHSTRPGCAPRR